MNPILLQTNYTGRGDIATLWIGLAVIAVIIGVNFARKVLKGSVNLEFGQGFKKLEHRFSENGFSRAARGYGFDDAQRLFLKKYGKKFNVDDAGFVFRNPKALDNFLRQVYQDIEATLDSDSQIEASKAILFSIREEVDRTRTKGKPVRSTREIADGTAFSFITHDEENYPSKIIFVEATGLVCETPKDSVGTEIRFKRGTRLQCYFYSQGQQGYSFEGRVTGYQTRGLRTMMNLAHSEHVTMLPNRLHIRRRLIATCSFVRAEIVIMHSGGKQQRKAVYDTRNIPGTLGDVSAGGVSIKTSNPLGDNEYLKVDFNVPGKNIEAVGKVVKINRLKGMGGIMHVQFVKITRKGLNSILSYVYGYEE